MYAVVIKYVEWPRRRECEQMPRAVAVLPPRAEPRGWISDLPVGELAIRVFRAVRQRRLAKPMDHHQCRDGKDWYRFAILAPSALSFLAIRAAHNISHGRASRAARQS
jgi:hypothetical protein